MAAVKCEVELYGPVKSFLEGQGYEVKAEIGGCDVLARRGEEPPVIVELKTRFSLELLLQGVNRLEATDSVYLAVPHPGRRRGAASPLDAEVKRLCRRLGLGLLTVDLTRRAGYEVEVQTDPLPYQPRRNRARAAKLLGEFARRSGDPNRGGQTRQPIVTAYRQDALRCARLLARLGPSALAALRAAGAPADASRILQRDVYGWFERVARGTYALTPKGRQGLSDFSYALGEEEIGLKATEVVI